MTIDCSTSFEINVSDRQREGIIAAVEATLGSIESGAYSGARSVQALNFVVIDIEEESWGLPNPQGQLGGMAHRAGEFIRAGHNYSGPEEGIGFQWISSILTPLPHIA